MHLCLNNAAYYSSSRTHLQHSTHPIRGIQRAQCKVHLFLHHWNNSVVRCRCHRRLKYVLPGIKPTNPPTPGFLTNTTTPPQAVWACSSGCGLRGPLTCATSIHRSPVDWRRPRGRPRQSWLRTIESDLKPLNLGLHSALRRATDRPSWRRIVEKAMLFDRATRSKARPGRGQICSY